MEIGAEVRRGFEPVLAAFRGNTPADERSVGLIDAVVHLPGPGRPMRRVLLRKFFVDVPSEVHERSFTFWVIGLAAQSRRGIHFPEYRDL